VAVTLRGCDPATVRRALADGDALPGTAGFAGELDGRLVRDVLGREPLYATADATEWSHDPTAVPDATPVAAGCVRSGDGERRVWHLPDSPPDDDDGRALGAVREAVGKSVRDVDGRGLAVAFSGGVDSAAVAAGVPRAPCYVAGFPDAHDVAAAREAAAVMGRDLVVVDLDHETLRRGVREVARATGRTNPMDVAIAAPLYLVAERAAADGHARLAVGQGADELFGGYAKVAKAADDSRVEADTVRGARRETVATLPEQLPRDVAAIRAAGVDPVAPLLHDRVVRAALPLPDHLLVAEGTRKVALRRAVRDLELVPAPVAAADKKAVQYGSLVSRELDRLARRAGFKRRMENHVGRYVESLLE
jgi:asparagine synthase (glutamine-hydrolysing)